MPRPTTAASAASTRHLLALAGAPRFQLDRSGLGAARSDDDLLRQADQVHLRELHARPLGPVVVEDVDAGCRRAPHRCVSQIAAQSRVVLLDVDQADRERGDRSPAR